MKNKTYYIIYRINSSFPSSLYIQKCSELSEKEWLDAFLNGIDKDTKVEVISHGELYGLSINL